MGPDPSAERLQPAGLLHTLLSDPSSYSGTTHKLLLPTRIDQKVTKLVDRKIQIDHIKEGGDFRNSFRSQLEELSDVDRRVFDEVLFDTLCDIELSQKDESILLAAIRAFGVTGNMDDVLQTLTERFDRFTNTISIRRQDEPGIEADYLLGPISSFLNAAKLLGPMKTNLDAPIGAAKWQPVAASLDRLKTLYSEPEDGQFLEEEISALKEAFNVFERERENGRQEVTFNETVQPLYEAYLDITGTSVTMKPALWRATSEFRKTASELGVDMARFWNLCDVDRVQEAVNIVSAQFDEADKLTYEKYLYALTGIHLEDVDAEMQRVLTDELTEAAYLTVDELGRSKGDFDQKLAGMRKMLTSSYVAEKQLGQIERFLKEYGIEKPITSLEEALAALDDPELRKSFDERQQHKSQINQQLRDLFNLDSYDPRFSLAGRVRDDLYIGDQTSDCTAFTPKPGVNAWTVPIWLSNPGFNFFIVRNEEGRLAGKFTMFLTVVDGKPAITIDGFEVGYEQKENPATKEDIKSGLSALYDWARRIGIDTVILNTTSNSSGAVNLLTDFTDDKQPYRSHELLGHLDGVGEFRQNVVGTRVEEEALYIQSRKKDDEVPDDSVRILERKINDYLQRLDGEARQQLIEVLQQGSWESAFSFIMETFYPGITNAFGSKWVDFEIFSDPEETLKHPEREDEIKKRLPEGILKFIDKNDSDIKDLMRNYMEYRFYFVDDIANQEGSSALRNFRAEEKKTESEAKDLDGLIEEIARVRHVDRTLNLDNILVYLYGTTTSKSGNKILLSLKLPRLTNPSLVEIGQ